MSDNQDATKRFRIEHRSGIIAVYDMKHPKYTDTPYSDYERSPALSEWTVASWNGQYNEAKLCWEIDPVWVDKAHAACNLLNDLWERAIQPIMSDQDANISNSQRS